MPLIDNGLFQILSGTSSFYESKENKDEVATFCCCLNQKEICVSVYI